MEVKYFNFKYPQKNFLSDFESNTDILIYLTVRLKSGYENNAKSNISQIIQYNFF